MFFVFVSGSQLCSGAACGRPCAQGVIPDGVCLWKNMVPGFKSGAPAYKA